MRLLLFIAGCLLATMECHATTLYKCVDAAGKITFTQQACPQGNAAGDEMRVRNPRISGPPRATEPDPVDATAGPLTTREHYDHAHHDDYHSPSYRQHQYQPPPPPSAPPRSRVTVVGASQPQPECSTGLNDRDLRSAKLHGEIVPGMTRKEVASMYGPVNRNAPARGAGVTTYWNDKYVSQTSVRFDANGCVVSSWQSGRKGR